MATQKKKPAPVQKATASKSKTSKASPVSANKKSAPATSKNAKSAPKKVAVQKAPLKKPVAKVTASAKPVVKKKTIVNAPKQVSKTDKNSKLNKAVKSPKVIPAKATKGAVEKKPALKLNKPKPVNKINPKPVAAKKTTKAVVKNAGQKKLATMKKTEDKTTKTPAHKKNTTPVAKATPVKKEVKSAKKSVVEKPAKKAAAIVAPKKTLAEKPAKHKVEETKPAQKAAPVKSASRVKPAKKEPKRSEKPFVMPKINTDKSREYKPAFTKSVLDQAPEEYAGPTMRYSDNELIEFRELITKKVETAKKELGYLQGLITRKDQLGGDENENRYMTMEDGGLSMEREQLSQMASRQINFIDHLEKAMMRIENKTYGICRVTGKLIDKARLRAVPHATLSIEAKIGRANANV